MDHGWNGDDRQGANQHHDIKSRRDCSKESMPYRQLGHVFFFFWGGGSALALQAEEVITGDMQLYQAVVLSSIFLDLTGDVVG